MDITKLKHWVKSGGLFLSKGQNSYVANHGSLDEILSNGRRNMIVISAHQDDEVIGMGGTIRLYSTGVNYERENNGQAFRNGGLGLYSKEIISDLIDRLAQRGQQLILPPSDSSNVIVVYVTDGAKSEQTIKNDLISAHPEKAIEIILDEQEVLDLQELTRKLNQSRYPETLHALSYVGATAAIFLEYPSSQIRIDPAKPTMDLANIIKTFKPEVIFTLSPFEFSHDSHILVSNVTLNATRLVQNSDYNPLLKGYPVWDPDKLAHREITDISEVLEYKLDAIHLHSILGSQGTYGRRYEVIRCLNQLHAAELISVNTFNAAMQRPRLPAAIMAVEIFVDMTPLLKDYGMTLKNFVVKHFQETLSRYPIQ